MPSGAATGPTPPAKLSSTEKALAGLLMGVGAILVAVLLSAFMASSSSWSLVSKESSETVAGTTQAGEKKATTTEYSSTVLITGLGIGALLFLSGAFYGRIREITLPGGGGIKVGDMPPEKKEELQKKIEKKAPAKAQALSGTSTDELVKEAVKEADLLFKHKYWGPVPEPPSEDLETIADEAVERASAVLAS
jgi:hypothetical protein